MIILTVPKRCAAAIRAGGKSHTLRLPRRIAITVGDTLSLRHWLGEPYRSAMKTIGAATCTRLSLLRIILVDIPRRGSRWAIERRLVIDCLRHTTAAGDAITAAEAHAARERMAREPITAKDLTRRKTPRKTHAGARHRQAIPAPTRLDPAAIDDLARRDGCADTTDLTRTLRDKYHRELTRGIIVILVGWDGPAPL